jgi:hypothetical protein
VTGYTNVRVTNGFYDTGVFAGTSAAAPYVGGVAALVEDGQPGDQSPAELTATLRSSSDDILISGRDIASGSGVVNAADAVGVSEATTPTPPPTATPTPTPPSQTRSAPGSGGGEIYDGATVYQGEEDITFVDQNGNTVSSLTGVSGDAEGQVLSPPIPQDQTVGYYSADGTSSYDSVYDVAVDQPRVTSFDVNNQSGKDIAGGSIEEANANLTVVAEYNYGAAEPLELTVEGEGGIDITDDVANTSLSNSGDQNVYNVNLTDQSAGTYIITVAGEDDLDFGTASQSTTVEVRPNDSPFSGTAGEYDTNGDGKITVGELGDAVTAYGLGELTAGELGNVITAFARS